MNIRIVIIEDEYFTRRAIAKYIEQLGEPYQLCGEAGNGRDGLHLLREVQPDIALVDITMPIMGGIEMMHQAMAESLPTQMIILTGYSEFSYAQAAVHLGVREYLLKPLRIEVLQQALDRVRKSLRRHSKKQIPEGIDLNDLLCSSLAEQLTRSGADSTDIELLLDHLSFPSNTGVYYVLLIQFLTEDDPAALMSALFAAALKVLRDSSYSCVGYYSDNSTLCIVLNTPGGDSMEKVRHVLKGLAETIHQQLQVQLKISMSSSRNQLSQLRDAYLEAQTVQQFHMFYDSKQIAFYTPQSLIRHPSMLFDAQRRQNLSLLLHRREAQSISEFITEHFSHLDNTHAGSDSVYLCAAEMLSEISAFDSTHADESGDRSVPGYVLPILFSINHLDTIREFVISRAMEAIEHRTLDESAYS